MIDEKGTAVLEKINHFYFTIYVGDNFQRKNFLNEAEKLGYVPRRNDIKRLLARGRKMILHPDNTLKTITCLSACRPDDESPNWYFGWGILCGKRAQGISKNGNKYSTQNLDDRYKLYIIWGLLQSWTHKGEKSIKESVIDGVVSGIKVIEESLNKKIEDVFKFRAFDLTDEDLEKLKTNPNDVLLAKLKSEEIKKLFEDVNRDLKELSDTAIEFFEKIKTGQKNLEFQTSQSQPKETLSDKLTSILNAINVKPFIILSGISGTGKTQIARILSAGMVKYSKENE